MREPPRRRLGLRTYPLLGIAHSGQRHPYVFLLLLSCLLVNGCTSARTWSQAGQATLPEFVSNEVVGRPVELTTEGRKVRGQVIHLDLEEEELLLSTESSAFDRGDTLRIAFDRIDRMTVMQPNEQVIGFSVLALAVAIAYLAAIAQGLSAIGS